MKKIVALVLALVLALSLATVAFAADESYFAAKVGGVKMTGVTLKEVKAAGEKNVAMYIPVVNVNGNEIPMALNLVEATEADYDFVFVSGKTVTYLKNSVNGSYCGEATVVAGVDEAAAVCGDIVVAEGVTLYEMDGKYYKAAGSWNLRTVLGNATKDFVVEKFYDAVQFTEADLKDSLKDFLVAFVSGDMDYTVYNLLNPAESVNVLAWALRMILTGAIANYDITNPNFWAYGDEINGFYGFRYVLEDLYGQLLGALTEGAFPGIAGGIRGFLASAGQWGMIPVGFGIDLFDEVMLKIYDALGIDDLFGAEYGNYFWYGSVLHTDRKYVGDSWTLNIAREVLKQGTSVRALALVDGKLITLVSAVEGEDYTVVAHTYSVDYASVAGKTSLTKVYCETCGTSFDFVVGDETDATVKFGVGNYEDITNAMKDAFTTKFLGKHTVNWSWDTMSYSGAWVEGTGYTWNMFDTASRSIKEALNGEKLWIGTAVAEAEAEAEGSEVESAKTFDAGIAVYAGMALMSVAGSAVVIGKKKEF